MNQWAVVDRFEAGKAVLLVGDDERQLIVDRTSLPADVKEGHWLRIVLVDGRLASAEIDEAQTAAAKARIAAKLEALRRGEHLH
jgi:hypothetical protein